MIQLLAPCNSGHETIGLMLLCSRLFFPILLSDRGSSFDIETTSKQYGESSPDPQWYHCEETWNGWDSSACENSAVPGGGVKPQ